MARCQIPSFFSTGLYVLYFPVTLKLYIWMLMVASPESFVRFLG